ncbi:MAG: hypothetical protein WD738_10765 [Pirellulales bacterium]
MRITAILPVCCALVTTLASTASAALLRYEPFSYDEVGTTMQGKTNPDGETWLRAGIANPPSEIKVASNSLSVPFPLLPPVGNSGEINGQGNGNGAAIRLALGQTISTGTVYYSFPLRMDELTGSNNNIGGFFIGLNNSTGSQTGNPTAVGARVQARIDPTDPTKYNLGVFRNITATASATSWSGPLTVGDTLFLVASYEIVSGNQNDIARLWINPDPSTFADPSFSPLTTPPTLIDNTTATGTDISIASIILRQSPAPHLTLDEIRVGTEWADVTPIPEPASLLLLLAGCVLMPWRGRIPHPTNEVPI